MTGSGPTPTTNDIELVRLYHNVALHAQPLVSVSISQCQIIK